MRKITLALCAIVALLATTPAAAASSSSCDRFSARFHVKAGIELARAAYAPKRHRKGASEQGLERTERHIACLGREKDRRAIQSRRAQARSQFKDYRLYRRIAPYPGPGSGPLSPSDGRWWAIPWYIVCGESGGNFRVNADGAYQIIPSTWHAFGGGRFAGSAGYASPLEQHIIASRAWGNTPWYGAC